MFLLAMTIRYLNSESIWFADGIFDMYKIPCKIHANGEIVWMIIIYYLWLKIADEQIEQISHTNLSWFITISVWIMINVYETIGA